MKKIIIGIMGPGLGAREIDLQVAYELGRSIALEGWVLLTGGRNVGVMEAASQGAKQEKGLTVGILPTADDRGISEAVDIAIFTDMGNARNNINVLSSDVVVACGMGSGTASEVALALKSKKPVILLNCDRPTQVFFQQLSVDRVGISESQDLRKDATHGGDGALRCANTPYIHWLCVSPKSVEEAIQTIKTLLNF